MSGDHKKESGEASAPEAASNRIADLLETVQAFATLDFQRRARVGGSGDELDALAAGINMLGEEVESAHTDLEFRVQERTEQLAELAANLEKEVEQRRSSEAEVRQSNNQLTSWVNHLKRLNREVEKLTEMSNLFQACGTKEEAFSVLGHVGPELFSDTKGVVFIFVPSRDVLEPVTHWGIETDPPVMVPRDCWGLRRGRVHRAHGAGGLVCDHLGEGNGENSLCVPLIAQGEMLGLLHLRIPEGLSSGRLDDEADVQQRNDLHSYEKLAVATSEQAALAVANLELKAALQAQSIRDPLTGLYNRRYLDETLRREIRRAEREGTPLACLMIDVDHFKIFNDTYGHDAGDATLKQVAVVLREMTRGEDVVCRFGGEEFTIIMAGMDLDAGVQRAEELRSAVAAADFDWHGQPVGRITLSAGVASFPLNAECQAELIRAADKALYAAKKDGRNQVSVSNRVPGEHST